MGEHWIVWFACLTDMLELQNRVSNHLLVRFSFSFSRSFFLLVQDAAWSLKTSPHYKPFGLTDRVCLFFFAMQHLDFRDKLWLQRLLHVMKDMHGFCETSGQNKLKDLCRENSCLENLQAKINGKTYRARLSSW